MSEFINGKPPDRAPRNAAEVVTLVIVCLFFFGMLGMAMLENRSIYQLALPIFLVSWAILLVIHEFGHALMAKALGWRVDLISIGTGYRLTTEVIWGMPTEFRAIPLSGFAMPRPTDLVFPRLKNSLIYAAGPGVELLLIGIFWLVIGHERFFSLEPTLWLIGCQSFCLAAAVGAFFTLVPLSVTTEHGKSWSDGLGMILSWTLPDSHFVDLIESSPDR